MSASVDATVRPRYGSMCAATDSPCRRAAPSSCGSRRSSRESRPHQDVITTPMPAPAISAHLRVDDERVGRRVHARAPGKKLDATSVGGCTPPCCQCA